MIPTEVWVGLALLFGGLWIALRVVESRRKAARVRVDADTVPAAQRLIEAYMALKPLEGDEPRDLAALPRGKDDIARALKTIMIYHAAHGDQKKTHGLKDAYLSLSRFQKSGTEPAKARQLAAAERRRLLLDIETFLASTSL